MLSGLTYKQFRVMVESCALREGVEVLRPGGKNVDPFATSIIGQLKFMARYGFSSHGSAACVIARRGLGFKLEKAVKTTSGPNRAGGRGGIPRALTSPSFQAPAEGGASGAA
ncbi:MAG: hypothetical protein QHH75_07145 [Bacillota bacterium]|nr:hypothetical protein [Bacillota bacterium]